MVSSWSVPAGTDDVGAEPAVEEVAARTADEPVGAGAAVEQVSGLVSTADLVVAGVAEEPVGSARPSITSWPWWPRMVSRSELPCRWSSPLVPPMCWASAGPVSSTTEAAAAALVVRIEVSRMSDQECGCRVLIPGVNAPVPPTGGGLP